MEECRHFDGQTSALTFTVGPKRRGRLVMALNYPLKVLFFSFPPSMPTFCPLSGVPPRGPNIDLFYRPPPLHVSVAALIVASRLCVIAAALLRGSEGN